MANVPSHAAPVKSTSLPFRPLIAPPQSTYWTDECGAVHVLLSSRRQSDSYEIIPIGTDLGGCAFRWFRSGAESYDVLASGTDSSCTCAGFCYTGGCKHIQTTFDLLELGVLRVAPDSASTDEDAP